MNPLRPNTEAAVHPALTHAQFVAAWRAGAIRVHVDSAAAAALLSARLLLPFVAIAVIGLGIALVLWGWLWLGLGTGAIGIVAPRLIKRGAGGFLLSQIAGDADLYAAGVRAGAIMIEGQESA